MARTGSASRFRNRENEARPPDGKKNKPPLACPETGKWRSFFLFPHLLQFASSRTYFARIKAQGKSIRFIERAHAK